MINLVTYWINWLMSILFPSNQLSRPNGRPLPPRPVYHQLGPACRRPRHHLRHGHLVRRPPPPSINPVPRVVQHRHQAVRHRDRANPNGDPIYGRSWAGLLAVQVLWGFVCWRWVGGGWLGIDGLWLSQVERSDEGGSSGDWSGSVQWEL